MYKSEKALVEKQIQNAPGKISLVVDCWSTKNGYAFHGIMTTYVDSDLNFRQLVLDFDALHGPHKGKMLAASILKTIEDFGITDKVLAITSDNASNMDTMFTELKTLLQAR
ncbi:unnamed protein product, partial [Allacma fusca]